MFGPKVHVLQAGKFPCYPILSYPIGRDILMDTEFLVIGGQWRYTCMVNILLGTLEQICRTNIKLYIILYQSKILAVHGRV